MVKYPKLWKRLFTDMIDSSLLDLLAFILTSLGIWLWIMSQNSPLSFWDSFGGFTVQIIMFLIRVALAYVYYVYGHFYYGTTLGKKPFKIYVVQYTGHKKITLKQSIKRFVGYGVSYLPCGLGFLIAVFQPEGRALHDMIAQTVSIEKKKN